MIEKPSLSVGNEVNLLPTEQIYGISVAHLPQIKSAELRFKSASKGLAIARGSRSPSISAFAGWRTNYYDQIHIYNQSTTPWTDLGIKPFKDQYKDNQSKYLQFSLNIPIFNGFATSSNIARAKISERTAEYDLQLSKNTLRKNIEQAYSDALAAYKTYNASIKSVASFQESFKYMEQKFNVGIENSLNYNVAKMQLTSAQSQLLSNKYDYIFKSKILDFYMGNPLTLDEN
jgi:outer membrane protein